MAYNITKAREAGATDEQIATYLKSTGRSDQEIKQIFTQQKMDSVRGLSETVGMTAGQFGGQALGAPAGPMGMAAGRFLGGTAGHVAGTAAPEMIKHGADSLKYLATMGRTERPKAPNVSPEALLDSAKRGGQASAFGEILPGAFKAGGMLRRAVSKETGTLKGLSGIADALTGQDANEFVELTKKPRALLYRWMGGFKGSSRAWGDFGKTLEKKGIPPEAVEFGPRETTASIKGAFLDLMDISDKTKDKILKQLPTAHLIKMMRAGSDIISDPATTRGFGQIKGFRQRLMAEVAERSDEIAEAWKDVASSQLAKSFHTPAFGLLPKAGDKAQGYKAFYEIRRMLPLIIGGAGAAQGSPGMAALGLLFSPLAMGIPFAAGGAAVKASLNPMMMSNAVKALQNFRKGNLDDKSPK